MRWPRNNRWNLSDLLGDICALLVFAWCMWQLAVLFVGIDAALQG